MLEPFLRIKLECWFLCMQQLLKCWDDLAVCCFSRRGQRQVRFTQMKSKESTCTAHHLQEIHVQKIPHNAGQLIRNMLLLLQIGCLIIQMVQTDSTGQHQVTEMLILEADRLV